MNNFGKLYLVSVPIGNPLDLTLRGARVLNDVDKVICENQKNGSILLKRLGILAPIHELNVNNESRETPILLKALSSGKSLALISDAGTPVFADPGLELLQGAIKMQVQVIPIPGVSSLMAALVISGFPLNEFHYAGFLPRQSNQRLSCLEKLRKIPTLLVFLETPYRLNPMLKDLLKKFPPQTPSVICMNLTLDNESIYRDTLKNIQRYFEKKPFKGEFVLLVENTESNVIKKIKSKAGLKMI